MLSKIKFIILNTLLFSLVFITVANAEEWVGYNIKKSNYSDYQGDERIPYMIFLDRTTYNSKSECYDEMVRKNPSTRASPYMVNCIEVSKTRCHELKVQMSQTAKTAYIDFGAYQKLIKILGLNKKDILHEVNKSMLQVIYIGLHENDPNYSKICRQKVYNFIKKKSKDWLTDGSNEIDKTIGVLTSQKLKENRLKLLEMINNKERLYEQASNGVDTLKNKFLQSGGKFYLVK